ncbi:MAG: hemolysin family protein [Candidatus Gastranaerophilales bacterium]|nr:hemolysin family protein [Candidatus Gastranaerophilales bacterium]
MSEGDSLIFNFFIIILLLFANGFFVASEFALVSVRHTRLVQLSNEGNSNAKIALNAIKDLDKYIAAVQLGITISSIGLGWLGEATLVRVMLPVFEFLPNLIKHTAAHTISVSIAFSVITLLHVVIGELMPKSVALQYPEKTSLIVARPMHYITVLFTPFIFVLNGLGNSLLKLINIHPASSSHIAHSTEELNMLINASYKEGMINETEKDMLQNVFKFSDLTAKQVMVPRPDMTCIPSDITIEELNKITAESQYTRYPVYEEDLDNITGIIHIKDVYAANLKGSFNIEEILREPMLIPETVNIDRLILDFKNKHQQIAIVIDEFGGTAGLITVEDVLEEIFGDVQDEFDEEEEDIIRLSDDEYLVNAMMRTDEISEFFKVQIDEDDVDTIGGFVIKCLGRLADCGDIVTFENLEFTVEEMSKSRITKLHIKVNDTPQETDEESSEG